ncbi:MAG: mechanosensitive ion channel family protein [Acidimicrobiia bacterium]
MHAVAAQVDPSLAAACGEDPSFVCARVLDWTGSEQTAEVVDLVLGRPLAIALIVALAWVANRLVRRAIARLVEQMGGGHPPSRRRRLAPAARRGAIGLDGSPASLRASARAATIGLVLRSLAAVAIWTVAGVTILGELGINLGPLVASAGIVGAALGFGAQSLVKDFLSGIFMLVEDQYGVGDVIDAGEASGTVEAVSLRTTRLRAVDGTVWHIPNGQILRVGNMSQQWARALLDVEVAHGTDLDAAQAVIRTTSATLRRDPTWSAKLLEDPEVWGVERVDLSGVAIRVVAKTRPSEQWAVGRELRRRLIPAFAEAGIELPTTPGTAWVPRHEGSSAVASPDPEPGPGDAEGGPGPA